MWKIVLIMSIFFGNYLYADCLKKLNLKVIKTDKNSLYYEDKNSGIVVSQTCFPSDASMPEMILQYKKSGEVDQIDDDIFFHTVKTREATLVSIFSYGESTHIMSALKNNKNPTDLKKFLKSLNKQ